MAFKNIAILLFFHTIFQSQLHKSIALDQTWIKAGYGDSNYTSPAAALYGDSTNNNYGDSTNNNLNTDYGISVWIKPGFRSEKLVLGLPFFGYVWTLVSPKNNQIGAVGPGTGPKGSMLGEGENEPFASTNDWLDYDSIKRDMIKYCAKNSTYNSTYVMNYVSIRPHTMASGRISSLSQVASLEGKDIREATDLDQSATTKKKKKLNQLILILIPLALLMSLLLLVFTLECLRRTKILKFQVPRNKIGSNNKEEKGDEETMTLQIFNFDEMKEATNNFSVENELGRGGYGPVYKGKLKNGKEIAVKRLSETSTQGLEEFENEVILTPKLQHINLVKVVGYCIEKEEKC